MDFPLRRGDKVRLLSDPGHEVEIEKAGAAGFKLKYCMTMFPWHEYNITWTSDKLDRINTARIVSIQREENLVRP